MSDYFPDEAWNQEVYVDIERANGSGPLRIGTFLETSANIYALLFASHFRTDIIDMKHWEKKHKQEVLELACEQYYEQNKLVDAPKEIRQVLEDKQTWETKRAKSGWYENSSLAHKKARWYRYNRKKTNVKPALQKTVS